MSISSIESLPYDILLKVISFAVLENAKSLLFANKSLIKYFYQKQVWKSLLEGCNLFSIQKIIRHLTCNSGSTIHQLLLRQLQEVVREVSRTSNPQQVKWHQIPSFSGAPVISRMEGHGMVTIADRYIAIVCAWGNQVRNNTIKIVDGWATPTAILPITTSTWDVPGNFRYGFSATVYKNEVIVYGGCLEGGYGGDCNDLYRINFSFEKRNSSQSSEQFDKFPLTEESYEMIANAPVKYWDRVVSSYSPNLKKTAPRQSTVSSSITPTQVNGCSRAYHAAAILHYRQRDHLMVFGGIHHHQSIFRMELYDINNDQWTAAEYEGNAPSPRFGCSCVPIPSVSTSDYSTTNRYIVTGGSDGSDLCRDGDELTDLFVLDVVRGHDGMSDKLVWTKVIKSSPFVAERCHSAVYFNDHVIYFGGGALTSSYTRILSIKILNKLLEEERKEEEGGVLSVLYDESDPTAIFQPTLLPRSNNYPPARLDGKAVMIGSQMIIFGGFSRRSRELGDFWSLDLSPGVKAFDRLRSPLTEEGEEGESEVNEGLKALRSLFAEKLQGGEGEESCSNIEIEEEEGNGDANEENEVNMTNDFLNHFILQNPIFAQLMQQGMFSIFGGEEEDPDEDEEWEAEEADDDDDEDNEEDENEDEKENEEVEDDETL